MYQSPARHTDPQLKPLLSAIRALLPARSLKSCSHWAMGLSLGIQAVTFAAMAGNAHAQPIPISTEPQNNQQQVTINSAITVKFNQQIHPGTGHFIISNDQGDTRRISAVDGNRVSISDSTLTIRPLNNLASNTTYTVSMEDGALTDDLDQPIPAIAAAAGLHFTTAPLDTRPPLPLSISPVQNATGVESSVVISAFFNKAIKAGIGNITLDNGKGDRQSIAIEDPTHVSIFTDQTNKQGQINFSLNKPLLKNSQYSVLVDQGAITDLAGNPFAGVQDKNSYTFRTVVDTTPPSLVSDKPLEVDLNGLTLTFNEEIQAGSGSIILIDEQGKQRSIAIHDTNQVSVSFLGWNSKSSSVRITPQDGLLAGSRYTVQLADGVVTDFAGNAFAGVRDNSLSVIMPTISQDKTPPHVISTIPSENQQQVLVGSNIEVKFDEDVTLTNASAFILSNGQGDTRRIANDDSNQITYYYPPGTKAIDYSRVIINPSQDLVANSRYTIQMPADTMRDSSGNAVQAGSLSFATASDGTPPLALNISPAYQSQDVPLDTTISLQFSEAVKAGSGAIEILGGNETIYISPSDQSQVTFQGNNVTIHPAQTLLPNSKYSINWGVAITDLSGNPWVSQNNSIWPSNFKFYTVTNKLAAPPIRLEKMLTELNRNGYTQGYSPIDLTFNVPIKPGAGYFTLSNGLGDTRIIDVKDSSQVLGFDGGYLTILPNKKLLPGAQYKLQIQPGAISDLNGNPYACIQDTSFLSFNTAPSEPPALQRFSLASNNSYVSYTNPGPHSYPHPLDSSIFLDFDTKIKIGTGNITLNNGQGDIRRIAITDQSQVKLSNSDYYNQNNANYTRTNNRIDIKPAQALLSNSRYSVKVDAGAVTDLNGIPFGGIQDDNSISFATSDAPPRAANSNPVQEINRGGTVGVYDNNDMLVFNFNESIHSFLGFYLSQHSFGGNDVIFSPDGRSASVLLNTASTIVRGDSVTFYACDPEDNCASVSFTL